MPHCRHCGVEIQETKALCPHCGGQPTSSNKGVILTVVAGCGCLAIVLGGMFSAILIPNFLDALQRAKQKRTMSDVRNVGTAMMDWLTDQIDEPGVTALPEHPSADELSRALVPKYATEVPATDGWGHELEYWVNPDLLATSVFRIRSPGRDGVFDADTYDPQPFLSTDYDRDVVWADGYFIRWPDGEGARR